MAQARFRGKVCAIREGAERVDGGMDEDAGIQAASAVKNRDKQEADRDGKNDLTQVIAKLHAAAVEQVDDMSDAEGDAGNDNGRLDIVPCDCREQEAAEDYFLQESDAEHTHDPADCFSR